MAIKRFSGSFKARTDILDNITPNNVVQPNVSAPAGEWKPAAWLPVEWQGEASKDFFVISSGKVVGFDMDGRVVPMRYKALAIDTNTARGTVALAYTSDDVTHGTINILDGEPVESGDVGNVTCGAIADALLARGYASTLTAADFAGADYSAASDADCVTVLDACFSEAVGINAYDTYAWAGDAPGELNSINYQKQHLVQFLTDIQLKVPVHVAHPNATGGAAELVTSAAGAINTLWVAASGDGDIFPNPTLATEDLLVSGASLATFPRYTADTTNVVGLALNTAGGRLADNTDRTPITNAGLTRERKSVEALRQAGDFFVDTEVNMILCYVAGGAAVPAAVDADAITFYVFNASAQDGSTSTAADHRFIHCAGNPKPGDHLTFDLQANLAPVAVDGNTVMSRVVGRCLAVVKEPRGLLDRVRTAWEGSSFDKTAQMPGTATKGYSDLITLSDEGTSASIAICNIKVQ